MSTRTPDPTAPQGAWAAWALAPLLLAASAVAIALGAEHITIVHGTGGACVLGGDCRALYASRWASLSGAPISLWAPAVHLAMALMLPAARRGDDRGRRARGALTTLSLGLVLASLPPLVAMVVEVGTFAPGCVLLGLLHLALLGVALAPPDGRRPAFPTVDEWLPALLIGLTALLGFGSGARIVIGQLDRAAEAAATAPVLRLPPETEVAVQRLAGEAVAVPPPRSPAPIDDEDPSIGPPRAAVQAVAFLDLTDPASRALAWHLSALEPRYADRVRFVYKALPRDTSCNPGRHRTADARACEVAIALQCAHAQRGFVPYRQLLLRNPHAHDDASLDAHARRIGLDMDAFAACRAGDDGRDAVEADVKQASKGALGDPPWLFVEGRVLEAGATEELIELTLGVALGEVEVDAEGRGVPLRAEVVDAAPPAGPAPQVGSGGVYVDATEAARDATGRAIAAFGAAPHPVSLDEARAACEAVGRRLCGRAEWVQACQGAAVEDEDGDADPYADLREGRLQPYGDRQRPGWCADQGAPGLAGAHPACRTPEGIHDLAGNLAEWVQEGVLLGGAAGGEVGCHVAETPPGPGWRTSRTGFRCCADAPAVVDVGAPAAPSPIPAPELAAPLVGPRTVVAWTLTCAGCQAALRAAVDAGGPVTVLDLGDDPAGTALWLEKAGVSPEVVLDPDARLAGALGVEALPWTGRYDAQGRLLEIGP